MPEDHPPQSPQKPDGSPPGPPRPGGPRLSRNALAWLFIVGVAIMLAMMIMKANDPVETIDAKSFDERLYNGKIRTAEIKGTTLLGTYEDQPGTVVEFRTHISLQTITSLEFRRMLTTHVTGSVKSIEENNFFLQWVLPMLPWMVLIFLVYFIFVRQMRSNSGPGGVLSFGKTRAKLVTKEHTNLTFEDVAGIDEARDEVVEIIEFLKNSKKFQRLGGRIPRGVILIGPPGTGKTLLAKAIAGEADVPFFSISGSDFVEMFVGVGASRVRDLFKQAKDSAPCIIFLDEIDAIGRRRGSTISSGGDGEREQTLNAILVEMDGFNTDSQVIVIAATNRSDVLDPALTRPGRFDRQIQIPLPDIKGREEILNVHAKNYTMSPDCDMRLLARGTPLYSGADLAAIINEAALAATMKDKDFVEQDDLEEARDKVRWGRARKSRVMDENDRRVTAYHEAGHAMATCLLPDADPLHKVSIIPRGDMGGATFMLPEKDRHMYTKKFAMAQLQVMFGGRVAEQLACDDISSGASQDIHQATDLARTMICDWGFSEKLGPIRYSTDAARFWNAELTGSKDYSEKTAEMIDQEVRTLVEKAFEDTKTLLSKHRDELERLAEALLKHETLDGPEVRRLLDGEDIDQIRKPPPAKPKKPPKPKDQPANAKPDADADPLPDAT